MNENEKLRGATDATRDLYIAIVALAPEWNGTPPCYDLIDKKTRGNLTDLKRRGLVTTFKSDGEEWIQLTELKS